MAAKLTVLQVSTELGWRGGEQQVMHLVAGLANRGVASVVASPPGAELNRRVRELQTKLADSGSSAPITVVDFPAVGGNDPAAALRLARLARETRVDIIHAHTSHAHSLAWMASWFPGASAMIRDLPIIVSRRVDFPVGRSFWGAKKYRSARIRYIAISNAVAEVLRGGGVDPNNSTVVHSGVDPTRFGGPRPTEIAAPARDEAAAAAWGADPGVPLLISVAALVDHKDHETLVRAAAQLRDRGQEFRLVIAGEGDLRGNLEQLIRESKLEKHVSMPGQLGDDDLIPLHRAADLFVLSSKLEGLGTAVIDAMAAGVPVVAVAAGGVSEIIEDGKSGWLVQQPQNPALLADAIQEALENPAARLTRSHEAAKHAAAEFSHDSMVEGTLAVYTQLVPTRTR